MGETDVAVGARAALLNIVIGVFAVAVRPSVLARFPAFELSPDVAGELLPSILRGVGMSDLPAPEAVATLTHPTLILTWDTDPLHPVSSLAGFGLLHRG